MPVGRLLLRAWDTTYAAACLADWHGLYVQRGDEFLLGFVLMMMAHCMIDVVVLRLQRGVWQLWYLQSMSRAFCAFALWVFLRHQQSRLQALQAVCKLEW